jgi:DNA-directed RNA polymerase specialized sigma24 family protein
MANEVRRAHQRRRRTLATARFDARELDHREVAAADEPTDDQRMALRAAVREIAAEWETTRTRVRQHRRWAAIARMIYLEQFTYTEAARQLGVSLKTIHNCLSRQIHPAIWSRIGQPERPDALDAAET